jgi:NDP-sugar pyrophosphorylase family protein
MNMNDIEVLKIVRELNSEIYKYTQQEEMLMEFITDGAISGVKFFGKYIWDEINDERKYINVEEDIQESLNEYLRREARKIINRFSNLWTNY